MEEHPKTNEATEGFTPITEVASVWFQRKTRLVQPQRAEVSGVLDPKANRYRCIFRETDCSTPTFLPPFAPRPLRRFIATMEALTPVRLFPTYRSPCLTHIAFPTIPSPTTWRPLPSLYHATCFRSARQISHELFRSMLSYFPRGSRLRHRMAGSPDTPGRNGFVILRTGRSPPVASHAASWRLQLQLATGCSVDLKRTCTSLTICAHRRTIPGDESPGYYPMFLRNISSARSKLTHMPPTPSVKGGGRGLAGGRSFRRTHFQCASL